MVSKHEELLEKHRRALDAESREEELMRRGEGKLLLARRAAFQKLTGEIEPNPDETTASLAEQICALPLAIDRTEELRRGMRGRPTSWTAQLDELGVPLYGEPGDPAPAQPTSLMQVQPD